MNRDFKKGLCVGTAIGVVGFLGLYFATPPNINTIEISRRENKPNIARVLKDGRDGLFVENQDKDGEYIKMKQYLGTIEDKGEREIERVRISDLAGFYD